MDTFLKASLLFIGIDQGRVDQIWVIGNPEKLKIALGIVFLMTVKPGLGEALLTIGLALVLGLALALPAWGRVRLQAAREER
jgi:hypothetical protein